MTLYFEDGTSGGADVPARRQQPDQRGVSGRTFPRRAGRRFGAVVESLGATPAQIVVERAMYSNAGGVIWAAGTNALATRLRRPALDCPLGRRIG